MIDCWNFLEIPIILFSKQELIQDIEVLLTIIIGWFGISTYVYGVVILLDFRVVGREEVVEGIEDLTDCQDLTENQWLYHLHFDVSVVAKSHIQDNRNCVLSNLLVPLPFADIGAQQSQLSNQRQHGVIDVSKARRNHARHEFRLKVEQRRNLSKLLTQHLAKTLNYEDLEVNINFITIGTIGKHIGEIFFIDGQKLLADGSSFKCLLPNCMLINLKASKVNWFKEVTEIPIVKSIVDRIVEYVLADFLQAGSDVCWNWQQLEGSSEFLDDFIVKVDGVAFH